MQPPPEAPPAGTARLQLPQQRFGQPPPAESEQSAALGPDRFAAPPPPPLRPDVPRIAILLPLSGPSAKIGKDLLNAAQLALFQFADNRFELLPHDTEGTPQGASEAAALAIGDGASLILGPLLSRSVTAVAPAARAAGVPVIAFTSDRTVAGDGVFTMGFLPAEEVGRIVSFAGQKGIRRIAVLAPDNDYGLRVVDEVHRVSTALGVVVSDIAYYDPLTNDFAPVVRHLANYDSRRQTLLDQIAELKGRTDEVAQHALARLEKLQTMGDVPFDALLIPEGGKKLQAIAALLPYYDLDPNKIRMLGTGQWDTPGLGAEPALVGGWYAAPSPGARADFLRQYKAAYGAAPQRLATLAYDATALAAVLAQTKGGFNIEDITNPRGFAGRDGIFRFLSDGTAERRLSILEVEERTTKVIDQAPESFGGVVN